jgi:hypothetical protein
MKFILASLVATAAGTLLLLLFDVYIEKCLATRTDGYHVLVLLVVIQRSPRPRKRPPHHLQQR